MLTYDEALGAATPAASAFAVMAGPSGSLVTVNLAGSNPVTVSGRTVTLTLATAVAVGHVVQVSYTVPGSGSKLQDALGNAAAALTDEAVTNDTAKPTVVIASAGAFPTKDAFAVTITFSEAVTGFAVEEIEVTEGAASNFSGSGTVYEIEVTPEADYAGDVTVTVAADAAEDSNGVGNASASKAFAVDTKGPCAVINGQRAGADLRRGAGRRDAGGERVRGEGGPSGSLLTRPGGHGTR